LLIILVDVVGQAPFKCPVCRAVIEVSVILPSSVVSSPAPPASFVSSMLVWASSSSSSSSSMPSSHMDKPFADPNNVLCEICEDEQACDYCTDCSQSFCASCKKPHLKAKVSSAHHFVSLDEALKPGTSIIPPLGSSVARCVHHPQQEINTYCHNDRQAICPECVLDFHKGHDVDRLSKVVQSLKDDISTAASKVCFSFFLSFFCFFSFLLLHEPMLDLFLAR